VIRTLLAYLPLGLWALAVLALGTVDIDRDTLPQIVNPVGHFLIYGVGGVLAAWLGRVRRSRREGYIGLLLVIFTGLVDEVHQISLPYRDSDVMDWLTDAAGAFIAFVLVARLMKRD
jgi:VanZ family protein